MVLTRQRHPPDIAAGHHDNNLHPLPKPAPSPSAAPTPGPGDAAVPRRRSGGQRWRLTTTATTTTTTTTSATSRRGRNSDVLGKTGAVFRRAETDPPPPRSRWSRGRNLPNNPSRGGQSHRHLRASKPSARRQECSSESCATTPPRPNAEPRAMKDTEVPRFHFLLVSEFREL